MLAQRNNLLIIFLDAPNDLLTKRSINRGSVHETDKYLNEMRQIYLHIFQYFQVLFINARLSPIDVFKIIRQKVESQIPEN